MTHRVFIEQPNEADYLSLIQQGLEWIAFEKMIPKDGHVFIKPNLTFPTYRAGVMTSPRVVEAVILAVREYTSNIYIGDSDSGGYNRFSMDEVYQETGLVDFAQKYGVRVVNLSKGERSPIHFQYRRRSFSLDLPRLLTDEIDLLITMPVPKIHMNTGVSLAFKNQWGCIPEPNDRLRLHPYLRHVLVEVNRAVKAKVAVMDGSYGLNVSGPMRGDPVKLDWIMVANDIGAISHLACELMQIPLKKIKHLRYAKKLGLIPDIEAIKLNQDFRPFVREKFFLKRAWTDYPGMLAFNSPFWAYIAYFSPLASLLHRILYLFREPFYDYDRYSQKQ